MYYQFIHVIIEIISTRDYNARLLKALVVRHFASAYQAEMGAGGNSGW